MSKNRNKGQAQTTESQVEEVQSAEQQAEPTAQEAGQELAQAVQAVAEVKAEEAPAQEAPTEAPAPAPVAAPAPVQAPAAPAGDLKAQIAEYTEKSSASVKGAFQTLETYLGEMATNKAARPEVILTQQKLLWVAIRSLVNNPDDFAKGWRLLTRLFKEHKDGALGGSYVYRGFEGIVMDSETIKSFQGLLNLLIISAGVNKPAEVRKIVSLEKTLNEQFFSEEVRARVFAYYS